MNVFLGDVEDRETLRKAKCLVQLKKDRAIVSSTIAREDKDEVIEGDYISHNLKYVECVVKPAHFVQYARKRFKPKLELVSTLASHIASLVKMLSSHAGKSGEVDQVANDAYMHLVGEIERVLREGKSSSLSSFRHKPFKNLYIAHEELRDKGMTMQDAIGSLNANLGTLHHLQGLYAFGSLKKATLTKPPMVLRKARRDTFNHQLLLDEKPFPFVTRKGKERDAGATKRFAIFSLLWDSRQELKKGKEVQKGDFLMVQPRLVQPLGITKEAVRKHIERLNERFTDEGVPIHIDSNRHGAYMIIVNLS